jgi:hypothetical protein
MFFVCLSRRQLTLRARRRGEREGEAYEVKPLLLDLVHDDLEDFVGDLGVAFAFAVGVEGVEPDLVC